MLPLARASMRRTVPMSADAADQVEAVDQAEASDQVEAGWPAIGAALARGEAVAIDVLLEDILGVAWTAPEAASVRTALQARLSGDAAYAQVAPGTWLPAGQVPCPPARTRMPTVRIEHEAPVLEEALDAWREVRDEEGKASFSRKLSFRDIQLGFLRLSGRSAELFPADVPARVSLVFDDGDRTAWWTTSPAPLLYGLESWIWQFDPGQYLRLQRVGPARFAVTVEDRFDEAYYRSEGRLFDLENLRRLRRFGMPYRDHVRVLLARHPRGLTARQLVDALEAELAFRPHPPTIRALLSADAAFVSGEGRRWRLAIASEEPGWGVAFRRAAAWFEADGEEMLQRQPYRVLLMTVGGSPEPLRHSLAHSRPEGVVFVASTATLPIVQDLVGRLPAGTWHETVFVRHHEDLLACLEASRAALALVLDRHANPHELLVDFTGGTKAMSAAVVLATHATGCGYAYVGGDARTKDGVGIVLDGHNALRVVPGLR